jgi:hypothetical protein
MSLAPTGMESGPTGMGALVEVSRQIQAALRAHVWLLAATAGTRIVSKTVRETFMAQNATISGTAGESRRSNWQHG